MKWGLIALNGKVNDVDQLIKQMARYTEHTKFDYVIGVDGGCALLQNIGIIPSLILGDFDSIESLGRYETLWPSAEVMSFPPNKDYTDSELAVEVILNKNLDRVVIIGALGGRMDHMLGTLFLLDKSTHLSIVDENNCIERIITPYNKKIDAYDGYVSLVPSMEGLHNITLKGFKYPLCEATILYTQTRGISNEIIEAGEIEIKSGSGYLILSHD